MAINIPAKIRTRIVPLRNFIQAFLEPTIWKWALIHLLHGIKSPLVISDYNIAGVVYTADADWHA